MKNQNNQIDSFLNTVEPTAIKECSNYQSFGGWLSQRVEDGVISIPSDLDEYDVYEAANKRF